MGSAAKLRMQTMFFCRISPRISSQPSRVSRRDASSYQMRSLDFVLRIDRDRAAICEPVQIDPVRLSVEAQVDAPMDEPFAEQALADAARDEQIHGALFEDAGADGGFHGLARTNFQHHCVHAAHMKQVRK